MVVVVVVVFVVLLVALLAQRRPIALGHSNSDGALDLISCLHDIMLVYGVI